MSICIVDIHAHMLIPVVEALVADRSECADELRRQAEVSGVASSQHNRQLFAADYWQKLTDVPIWIAAMDAMGVDVQAISVSSTQYYYWADRDLAQAIVRVVNEHLAQ